MPGKYPSKRPSKTPAPPTKFTQAQLDAGERQRPSEKQPFGYSFYKNPWLGPLSYLFGAGGMTQAKSDEKMRLLEEKRRVEEELRLREERIRKSNADKERSRRIQAQAKEDREEQEETDRYYEELDRKNREKEGQGNAI